MSTEEFREMALSFPGAEENPHFDRRAFKVVKKRNFTTLHEPSQTANVKLSLAEQSVFCEYDKDVIYPVPNKWGEQGWTTFELDKVPPELMLDALNTAYTSVFEKK